MLDFTSIDRFSLILFFFFFLIEFLCGWQLLDLPGIIEGAKDGKGRGRQVRCAYCCLRELGCLLSHVRCMPQMYSKTPASCCLLLISMLPRYLSFSNSFDPLMGAFNIYLLIN